MAPHKPTILFVHGAWHQPVHFERIRKVFEHAGYPTSCPLLPSIGAVAPVGLVEDAQCVRDALQKLVIEEGRDVVVIAHSYGGVVITEAVNSRFAKNSRLAVGGEGGVLRLVYMCAFLLPHGSSLAGTFGGQLPPFIQVDDQGLSHVAEPEKLFYQDLPAQEQMRWAAQLRRCPIIGQQTALTHAAYLHHPVTYLYCENDAALPLHVQQMMVQNARKASDLTISTATCPASHSPYLSMPERVLELIEATVA